MSAEEEREEAGSSRAAGWGGCNRRKAVAVAGVAAEGSSPLSALADDVLLQILGRLEGDPRDWARASCASPRFAALLRAVCLPPRLTRALPAELLPPPAPDGAPRAWAALHKLSVCCPGLLRAGVLLEPSNDFGLELDIGPDLSVPAPSPSSSSLDLASTATSAPAPPKRAPAAAEESPHGASRTSPPGPSKQTNADSTAVWSLYDDLYLDAAYDCSPEEQIPAPAPAVAADGKDSTVNVVRRGVVSGSRQRPRRWLGTVAAHLASGSWTLSREQGNKLLASRFRGDRLYICDWPGCVHAEERRKYMVFRGVFHNFARSQVRRALRDTRRPTVAVDCAFCGCTEAWDLYSAFCLRSFYGYHDDGEPVVRAYVCENGHVAGAWTERPLYS
ncbi:hypothetical protein GUJ93_ZPchr0010g8560 [Zizania palustris]|uniref:Phytochrome A-associated F-box protein n=1 Tax=Zizania palustris TaxID=103762 RepID=A0A8J5WA05_ZIZPA|nr:hypothetical protein GUJ93_ZPchr0010g8560 [Zizania palustris]